MLMKEDEKCLWFGDKGIGEGMERYEGKVLIVEGMSWYMGEKC